MPRRSRRDRSGAFDGRHGGAGLGRVGLANRPIDRRRDGFTVDARRPFDTAAEVTGEGEFAQASCDPCLHLSVPPVRGDRPSETTADFIQSYLRYI
mgnify:CR=1 FL=1